MKLSTALALFVVACAPLEVSADCDQYTDCAECSTNECGWCLAAEKCVEDKPGKCLSPVDHVGGSGKATCDGGTVSQKAAEGPYDAEDPKSDHFAEAVRLDEIKDFKGAMNAFHAQAKHNPNLSGAWSNYAVSAMRARQYEAAQEAIDKALGIDPDDTIAQDNQKALQSHLDHHAKMKAQDGGSGETAKGGKKKKNKYQKVNKKGKPASDGGGGSGQPSADEIAEHQTADERTLTDAINALFDEAIAMDEKGDYGGAAKKFVDVAEKAETNGEAWMNAGVAMMRANNMLKEGRVDGALRISAHAMLKAEELLPSNRQVKENMQLLKDNLNKLDANKAVSEAKTLLGVELTAADKAAEDAAEDDEKYKESSGGDGGGGKGPDPRDPKKKAKAKELIGKAIALDEEKKFNEAAKTFLLAAKQLPNDVNIWANAGVAHMRAYNREPKPLEKAIIVAAFALNKARTIDPKDDSVIQNVETLIKNLAKMNHEDKAVAKAAKLIGAPKPPSKAFMTDVASGGGGGGGDAPPKKKKKKKNKYQTEL